MMKVATVSRHVADDRMERMMNIARLIGWGEEVLRVWSWKDNALPDPDLHRHCDCQVPGRKAHHRLCGSSGRGRVDVSGSWLCPRSFCDFRKGSQE